MCISLHFLPEEVKTLTTRMVELSGFEAHCKGLSGRVDVRLLAAGAGQAGRPAGRQTRQAAADLLLMLMLAQAGRAIMDKEAAPSKLGDRKEEPGPTTRLDLGE